MCDALERGARQSEKTAGVNSGPDFAGRCDALVQQTGMTCARLLNDAELPITDLGPALLEHFLIAELDDDVVGLVGLEVFWHYRFVALIGRRQKCTGVPAWAGSLSLHSKQQHGR